MKRRVSRGAVRRRSLGSELFSLCSPPPLEGNEKLESTTNTVLKKRPDSSFALASLQAGKPLLELQYASTSSLLSDVRPLQYIARVKLVHSFSRLGSRTRGTFTAPKQTPCVVNRRYFHYQTAMCLLLPPTTLTYSTYSAVLTQ
ncbi:unnamed protein product [Ectocarpus fasciculatus]